MAKIDEAPPTAQLYARIAKTHPELARKSNRQELTGFCRVLSWIHVSRKCAGVKWMPGEIMSILAEAWLQQFCEEHGLNVAELLADETEK